MKKIAVSLIAAFALLGAVPAFADAQAPDPAAVAAAREMFDAMKYREMMQSMMPQLGQGMSKAMHDGAAAAIKNDPKARPPTARDAACL